MAFVVPQIGKAYVKQSQGVEGQHLIGTEQLGKQERSKSAYALADADYPCGAHARNQFAQIGGHAFHIIAHALAAAQPGLLVTVAQQDLVQWLADDLFGLAAFVEHVEGGGFAGLDQIGETDHQCGARSDGVDCNVAFCCKRVGIECRKLIGPMFQGRAAGGRLCSRQCGQGRRVGVIKQAV